MISFLRSRKHKQEYQTSTAIHFPLYHLVNNLFKDFHVWHWLCAHLLSYAIAAAFSLFSCGCTVTPFAPIYLFLFSLLHFQKCLLTVHKGASADALSISLHLPLILTLLRLYNRKTTPQGTLFIHATMFTEYTQRASWRFKSVIQKDRGQESLACSGRAVNWGTNSIAMTLHSSLLP